MYTNFFGNYLLHKDIITRQQLLAAMSVYSTSHVKLGTLAIHSGYITVEQAEDISQKQMQENKYFGELAVELGYMTQEQLYSLLSHQAPDYMLMGQILVDQGALTLEKMTAYVDEYSNSYHLEANFATGSSKGIMQCFMDDMDLALDTTQKDYLSIYLLLLLHSFTRFIGDDFSPLDIYRVTDLGTDCLVEQNMDFPYFSAVNALNMEPETAAAFASRFTKEEFPEYNPGALAALQDFLHIQNGLFAVDVFSECGVEVTLQTPMENDFITAYDKATYILPLLYSFGTVQFIFSVIPKEEDAE